jgi:hypothetical protein
VSLDTLLSEEVTILRHSAGAEDVFGDETDTFTSVGTFACRLEQRSAQEVTRDRQTVVSDWVLFLHPTTVLSERDRVTDAFGRTFEVVASAMRSAPGRDVFVEASLVHVDGG